jgi:hypothetical protein
LRGPDFYALIKWLSSAVDGSSPAATHLLRLTRTTLRRAIELPALHKKQGSPGKPDDAIELGQSARASTIWPRVLRAVDWAIRFLAVVVILMFGLPILLFLSAMATDTGTTEALVAAFAISIGGLMIFALLALMSIFPGWFAKHIHGPRVLGTVLVRVPVYIAAAVGLALLLYQVW